MDRRCLGLFGLLTLLQACSSGQEVGISRGAVHGAAAGAFGGPLGSLIGATLGAGIGLAFAPDDYPEVVTLSPLKPPLGGDIPIRTVD
ncbi:MAG: YtxH domain-containing protein [Magnetospirillum sp.]|nr:YtxH domain-containing protein [Magnetospirillum sp.]